jgi:Anti-sigma-28 factor, FlgM
MNADLDEISVVRKPRRADEGGIRNQRISDLKREIENNAYAVDAPAVADAILAKIRLLKQAHQPAAISEAGRIPPAPETRPGLST